MTSLEDIKKEAVDLVSFFTLWMFGLTVKRSIRITTSHCDFGKSRTLEL